MDKLNLSDQILGDRTGLLALQWGQFVVYPTNTANSSAMAMRFYFVSCPKYSSSGFCYNSSLCDCPLMIFPFHPHKKHQPQTQQNSSTMTMSSTRDPYGDLPKTITRGHEQR